MPYLNWKQRQIRKKLDAHADARSSLHLELDQEERSQLLPLLEDIFVQGGTELRVDLPDNWILFWKSRENESRLLIAHPQQSEWVTTIALETEHGKRAIERLGALGKGDAFSLSEQGPIGAISNVEVVIGLV